MEDCLFCKIVNKEIPAKIINEGDDFLAFKDIHPMAPEHVLVIPKKHIASLDHVQDIELLGKVMQGVIETARKMGLSEKGYRVVNNVGRLGGQAVGHLHFHILSGRQLGWPPG